MTSHVLRDAAGKTINMVDVGGYIVGLPMQGCSPEKTKAMFEYIPYFKCREDDVMLLSYPKAGTNWLYEILMMLLTQTSERIKTAKLQSMLEFHTQEEIDQLPSPRVINTHVPFRFLPKELKEKKLRTVMVVRNPKDTLVSYYNHMHGFRHYGYDGEWKDWFQLYMQEDMEYGPYTNYLKEVEKAMKEGIDYPFHLLYYEDIKLNGLQEIRKLASFLGVSADDDLLNRIDNKCSFDSMLKNHKVPEEVREKVFTRGFNFFRKGQIGDWKNWFTVAQNEQFDAYWEKEMADSKFKFTYSQTLSF